MKTVKENRICGVSYQNSNADNELGANTNASERPFHNVAAPGLFGFTLKTIKANQSMNETALSPWQPGQPVTTPSDVAQWEAWKKKRIRDSQCFRRALYKRIDYYPSNEALDLIDSYLNGRRSYAHIIDALVLGEVPE